MEQESELIQTKTQTQNEIVQAALKLFAGQGYFNTSLSDIAKVAGLKSTHTLYDYFSSKQMIAKEVHDSIVDSLNISIDDIRRRNQKASEQLHDIVDLFFKLSDDAPAVMQFLLLIKVEEFLPDQKPVWETTPFVKIIKIIRAGVAEGEIRNIDPSLANAYFFGIINNTLRMVLKGELDKKADAYLSQAWLAAWNSIAVKK